MTRKVVNLPLFCHPFGPGAGLLTTFLSKKCHFLANKTAYFPVQGVFVGVWEGSKWHFSGQGFKENGSLFDENDEKVVIFGPFLENDEKVINFVIFGTSILVFPKRSYGTEKWHFGRNRQLIGVKLGRFLQFCKRG